MCAFSWPSLSKISKIHSVYFAFCLRWFLTSFLIVHWLLLLIIKLGLIHKNNKGYMTTINLHHWLLQKCDKTPFFPRQSSWLTVTLVFDIFIHGIVFNVPKLLITVAGYISHHTDEVYTEGEGGQQLVIINVWHSDYFFFFSEHF